MIERWTSLTQRRWAFWLALAAVLALSLLPPTQYMPSTGWDKLNHTLGFAVLAFLGLLSYPGRTTRVLLGMLAYGVLMEVLQSLTGYRQGEALDLVADAIGIAAGWQLTALVRRSDKQPVVSSSGE